jgi:hypothetical protein
MKITENQLRSVIREQLLQEGFLSDLWHSARQGISRFVRPDDLNGDMSIEEAEGDIDRAVLQYALSHAQQTGAGAEGMMDSVAKALEYVNSQKYQTDVGDGEE